MDEESFGWLCGLVEDIKIPSQKGTRRNYVSRNITLITIEVYKNTVV